MPKLIEVDQGELEAAIDLVEEKGALPNLSSLYSQVSEAMGGTPSPQVVKARIKIWRIEVKTQPGRKKKEKVAAHQPPPVPSMAQKMDYIYTPAGKCPYKLTGSDTATVKQWANEVHSHGITQKIWYSPEALCYFSRQFFDISTPEYDGVKEIVKSLPMEESGHGSI